MEELKLILESIQTLGGDAKTAFIVWVLCRYLLGNLVSFLLISGIIYTVYRLLAPLTSQFAFISQIKGVMSMTGELDPRDKMLVINTLKKGLDKKND